MKQIRLGRSDLQVSRIAFGTWQLGGDWGATDETAAIAAIRHAADQGINFATRATSTTPSRPPASSSTTRPCAASMTS
jgi:aryl-alcohol dehydrogenase-like predicted oxidoreductase